MMFDLLEIFQNITNIENYTPGTQQVQDHLMVDLALRLLEQGIEHEIYCAMHGATWGGDPTQSYTTKKLNTTLESTDHSTRLSDNRPPPRPGLWVASGSNSV